MSRHPASYRDPSGHVYMQDGRVCRTVLPAGVADYEFVRDSGLARRLTERGWLIAATEVPRDTVPVDGTPHAYVLEHPRLAVQSYPYEWSFPALKDAALLQLDIQLEALAAGVMLSDASAYNVMFDGPTPVFIDYLSFRRYREGEFWAGHRQFCEQYLNPLLLTAYAGVPFQPWYRGAMEGIPPALLANVLPVRRKWSWRVMTHVILQASMERPNANDKAAAASKLQLPLASLRSMLGSLRSWIAELQPSPNRPSIWSGYASDNSYTTPEATLKRAFVERFAAAERPKVLLDIGCNTGDYSAVALRAGAGAAVGWESDAGALDAAYLRARKDGLRFLPLWGDAVNPSPGQGVGRERAPEPSRAHGGGRGAGIGAHPPHGHRPERSASRCPALVDRSRACGHHRVCAEVRSDGAAAAAAARRHLRRLRRRTVPARPARARRDRGELPTAYLRSPVGLVPPSLGRHQTGLGLEKGRRHASVARPLLVGVRSCGGADSSAAGGARNPAPVAGFPAVASTAFVWQVQHGLHLTVRARRAADGPIRWAHARDGVAERRAEPCAARQVPLCRSGTGRGRYVYVICVLAQRPQW
ncbi:MAG: hypothetical protein IPP20_18240 [Gemmatimonadetes bacterium]|nr:hypothetical protein [Gemmatimonadota bacterium]